MTVKRKNRVWTLLASFIPGCAQMYWGLLRTGLSHLVVFMGIFFFMVLSDLGELILIDAIVWLYSFCHARCMAYLTDEELALVKDEYFGLGDLPPVAPKLSGRIRTMLAGVLIFFGVYMIAYAARSLASPYLSESALYLTGRILNIVPSAVLGVAVVWLGIAMICGQKWDDEKDSAGREEEKRGDV